MDLINDGIPGHYKSLTTEGLQNTHSVSIRTRQSKEKLPPHKKNTAIKNNHKCSDNALYYFQSFSDNASIDGLKFLGEKGRTVPERIFWAITLSIALVLSIILIAETFQKWINSPVIVTFSTGQTSIFEVPFPAITICPEVKSYKDLFNYTEIYLKKENNVTLTPEEAENFEYMSLICDTPSELIDGNATLASKDAFDFLFAVAPYFHDSVLEFVWRGNKSNTEDFLTPILTSEGVCYTFNMLDRSELFTDAVYYQDDYFSTNGKYTQWSPEVGYVAEADINAYPRRTLIAGLKGGLSIVFMLSKEELDYACGDSLQGFKVTLHQPAEFPRVRQNYFRLPLDQSMVAAIKPNMMTTSEDLRSYSPQDRKCYFLKERNLKYFKIYNQQNCLIECLVNFTIRKCGCVNFHLPREESTPICGFSSKDCMENAKISFLENEVDYSIKQARKSKLTRNDLNTDTADYTDKCNCLPSCHSLDFDVETSQSKWDWEEAFKVLREVDGWNDTLDSIFGNNSIHIMRMMIYFKDMQFLTSERNELYGYTDFWANVGGIIGLFTGFSFITMFELFYYLTLRLFCNIKMFGRRVWSGAPELLEEGGIEQK